ncbi:type IX secretion system sortase PorU, partial [candidate division KSB1 bacterium]|nr:type IX secretion system sortase PorU [candidate division KSB1 bacterium]
TFNTSAGEPQIPERILIVGIPVNSRVVVEVLEAAEEQALQGRIIPTPTYRQKEMAVISYNEDKTIYHLQGMFPAQLVEIASHGMMANQQIAVLRIQPVQYFPGKDQILLYKRIVVRVSFTGGEKFYDASDKIATEFIPNQVLINSKQAAKWRKPREHIQQSNFKKSNPVDWYKIYVREEGVYKINGTQLRATGIDLRNIKPDQVKIFNNGGFQLPTGANISRIDSLIENAIIVSDGGDNKFDDEDYILFYAKAVNGWRMNAEDKKYSHYLNPFTRDNVYWLCWQSPEQGKRMQARSVKNITSAIKVDSYQEYIYLENEYTNLLKSGTTWFGDYFSAGYPRRNYQFDLSGIDPQKNADLRVNLAGVSSGEHRFRLYINDIVMSLEPVFYSSSGRSLSYVTRQFHTAISNGMKQGYNNVTIEYQPASGEGLAYLDWIELSYQRRLEARDDQLIFNGSDSASVCQYFLSSFSSTDILVFNISDFSNVTRLEISQIGGGLISFNDSTASDKPSQYFAVSPKRFKSVSKIVKDSPSRLREDQDGADFIIITHDDFYDAALALKSLRENCDSLTTSVVKISDVFDEFAWGLTDPTAIRDFIKFAYENWSTQPRYVLLLGDGDYDYKNIISPNDPNWIPPFETSESNELLSRARDDWFVCVSGNDNLMDLAIGRIPVRNPDQAFDAIHKIIEYENSPSIGEWCNTITMAADDELEQGGRPDVIHHIPDAEYIAEHLIPPNYNVKKIYLTEYPAIHDATISGIRKPAAREALVKQIDKGNLIINFIGHGNEQLWTHERILVLSDDFPSIDNGQKQAFWIAATCNFGRFDNPDFQSFAEQLTTVAKKGAIAVFSPCRLADAAQNVSLNEAIYRNLFSQDKRPKRLGDIVSSAKNSLGNFENSQFYNLLGDPTLRLMMPSCTVNIDKQEPDSLKALCRMEVGGSVEHFISGTPQSEGQILIEAFDSRKDRAYKVNEWRNYYYKLPGNTIFRGTATCTDGQFQVRFIVPKDITYGGKEGRFNVFYCNNQNFGSGYLNNITVGGTEKNISDIAGPMIRIGFNGQSLTNHENVPANPILNITIADSVSGVNIAGDIGHEIAMVLDDAQERQVILNDFFQYDKDSYLTGNITYPLGNLSEGMHSIQVKAWDNNNNSSHIEAAFTIVSLDKLVLHDVFNFPNPFAAATDFTFWVNQDCDVEIKVYTLSGRLIYRFDNLSATSGFNHFFWNGEDGDGNVLANGVYLYKVTANHDRSQVERIEKCVIMR